MSGFRNSIKKYLPWMLAGLIYLLGQAQRIPNWQNIDVLTKRNVVLLGLHGLKPLFYYFIILVVSDYIINKDEEHFLSKKVLSFLYLWFGLITAIAFGLTFIEFPFDTALLFRFLPLVNNSLPIIFTVLVLLGVGPVLVRGLEKIKPNAEAAIVFLGAVYLVIIPFLNHFFIISVNSLSDNWLIIGIYIFILYHWLCNKKNIATYWFVGILISFLLEVFVTIIGENRFQLLYDSLDVIEQPIILFIAVGLVLLMKHLKVSINIDFILYLISAVILSEYGSYVKKMDQK